MGSEKPLLMRTQLLDKARECLQTALVRRCGDNFSDRPDIIIRSILRQMKKFYSSIAHKILIKLGKGMTADKAE
jgi:hypothetical protein